MNWPWRTSERTSETDSEADAAPHPHVYMVRCADGSLFTGIAADPQAALLEINSGRGPQYTRTRRPAFLVYREEFMNLQDAERRVESIRDLDRGGKELLLSELSLAALE
ncbi:MAG: GIY-YIG nuclease family protein [bacterium]